MERKHYPLWTYLLSLHLCRRSSFHLHDEQEPKEEEEGGTEREGTGNGEEKRTDGSSNSAFARATKTFEGRE